MQSAKELAVDNRFIASPFEIQLVEGESARHGD